MEKRTILILCDWFLPGCMAGGPIQSIATLTFHLKDEFNFKIITTDRDFNSNEPYKNIIINQWVGFEGREVFYVSPENLTKEFLLPLIQNTTHDVLYLNSLFSKLFAIKSLLWKKQNRLKSPVILAPRGMFGEKALAIKPFKKKLFLLYAKATGLFSNVIWQSTSEQETKDIKKHIGHHVQLHEIKNLPHLSSECIHIKKEVGELRLCFIARIQPIKNLDVAINSLKLIETGKIIFDVFGPKEDEAYWNNCENLSKQLPVNISFAYKGILKPHDISKTINQYHALLLPTQTENFGHVIVETLLQSRPVIISDNTPWRSLEKYQAGYDINLNDSNKIAEAILKLVLLNDSDFQMICKSTSAYINKQLNITETKQKYIDLFNRTI